MKVPQWEEEDMNSTANFDINCHYKVVFASHSISCNYVDINYLYYSWSNGTIYNTNKGNRKASSSGHAVVKIFRQKFE